MNSLDDLAAITSRSELAFERIGDLEISDDSLLCTLAKSNRSVISSAQGAISVVEETYSTSDYSATTVAFDMHNDGLYLPELPRFVLLYCEDAGRGDSPTLFCDAEAVATDLLSRAGEHIFDRLSTVYIGRNGEEHEVGLIQAHPRSGKSVLILGSRAYVRPKRSLPVELIPTLRQLTTACEEVYRAVDRSIVHEQNWRKGDTVVFDNYRFLHARGADRPDRRRRLKRVWFS